MLWPPLYAAYRLPRQTFEQLKQTAYMLSCLKHISLVWAPETPFRPAYMHANIAYMLHRPDFFLFSSAYMFNLVGIYAVIYGACVT
jgi:hypothetical protein